MADPVRELTQTFHLVHRAKAGQQEALGRLFDRYYERVRKIVHLRLGNKLRSVLDVEDILQETFMAALKSFDRFELRNESSVINWLSRIAERAIIGAADHFGAKKREQGRAVPLNTMDSQVPEMQIPDKRRGPGTSIGAQEEARIVETCIAVLPETYREIIVLKDYVGYSWEDVAKEHGRPSVDSARMMHAKAMVKLDKLIRERTRGL